MRHGPFSLFTHYLAAVGDIITACSMNWSVDYQKWLYRLNLHYLWENLPLALYSWVFFTVLSGASRYASPWLFPSVFRRLTKAELKKLRITWPHHVVSLVHAILVTYMAVVNIWQDELREARILGYASGIARMSAVTLGYFLWDLKVSIHYWRMYGNSFLVHATMALVAVMGSYSPFLMYYMPYFLLFEVSTVFVNVHWFMGKLGMEGSRVQKANDILLLLTYFFIRICFGLRTSYRVWRDILAAPRAHQGSTPVLLTSLVCNVATNCLNLFWFSKLAMQAAGLGPRRGKPTGAIVDVREIDQSSPSHVSHSRHKQRHAEVAEAFAARRASSPSLRAKKE